MAAPTHVLGSGPREAESITERAAARPTDAGAGPGWDPKRIQRRLLQLETRRRIYETVQRVPGIHLRRLVRDLGFGLGTVEHHLHVLERHGLLRSHVLGAGRRAFFVADAQAHADPELWMALRTPSNRRILEALFEDPDLAPAEIAARLRLSAATISYPLQRLVGWGIGRGRIHQIADPDGVRRLLDVIEAEDAAARAPSSVLQYLLARIPPPDDRGVKRAEEERTIRR
jgi:DNA-binding transcriptional ArsR family regulator